MQEILVRVGVRLLVQDCWHVLLGSECTLNWNLAHFLLFFPYDDVDFDFDFLVLWTSTSFIGVGVRSKMYRDENWFSRPVYSKVIISFGSRSGIYIKINLLFDLF